VLGYNWLVRRNTAVMERVRGFSAELHTVLFTGKTTAAAAAATRSMAIARVG
jgi:biopolymer transport protein ExbB